MITYTNFYSTVEFKSVNNNKSCQIQSLDHGWATHGSVVTPIGVITCGGKTTNWSMRRECVRLSDQNTWESFPSMNEGGFIYDMVVIGDIILAFLHLGSSGFDVDGFEKINWRDGEKWELIKVDRKFSWPCITIWDDESILITGGDIGFSYGGDTWIANATWILNITANTMKKGPSLNKARSNHGCARISNDLIMVAGGFDLNDHSIQTDILKSTEILKVGELEWKYGPDLKEAVANNKVVKGNGEDYGAYSIGGQNEHWTLLSEIYGLHHDSNEWQLIDNMNEPRFWGSALNIPSCLIPWCEI